MHFTYNGIAAGLFLNDFSFMDRIGYIITNNFILIGVDTNLVLTLGSGSDSITLRLTDARKVRLLSPTVAVAVVGLPAKAGDLYKYLEALRNTDNTFDEVVSDVTSLFNQNVKDIQAQMLEVRAVIMDNLDEQGAIKEDAVLAHFVDDLGKQQLVIESLQMLRKQNHMATQFFAFAHEHGKNLSARYIVIGANASGHRQENLPVDNYDFVLTSSLEQTKKLETTQGLMQQMISGSIPHGWDNDPAKVDEIKEMARGLIRQGLEGSNPFPEMKPNILFYELSAATGYVFAEPEQKLRQININRS